MIPLYRGDGCAFEVIFPKGFFCRGTNPDLLAHVTDGGPDSIYISTSKSKQIATLYAKQNAFGKKYFVYEINPQKTGIDVSKKLTSDTLVHPSVFSHKEVAVPNKIAGTDIKGVWILEQNTLTGNITKKFVNNPSYTAPLPKTAAALRTAGKAMTGVAAMADAVNLCYAFFDSADAGNYERFFNEGARIAGGWSAAIAAGAVCGQMGALWLAPFGPVASLLGGVAFGAVGSIAAYYAGGALAQEVQEKISRVLCEEKLMINQFQLELKLEHTSAIEKLSLAKNQSLLKVKPAAKEAQATTKPLTDYEIAYNRYLESKRIADETHRVALESIKAAAEAGRIADAARIKSDKSLKACGLLTDNGLLKLTLMPTQLIASSPLSDAIIAIKNFVKNTELKKPENCSKSSIERQAIDNYIFNKMGRRLPFLPFIIEAYPNISTADEFYKVVHDNLIRDKGKKHWSGDALRTAIELNQNHANALHSGSSRSDIDRDCRGEQTRDWGARGGSDMWSGGSRAGNSGGHNHSNGNGRDGTDGANCTFTHSDRAGDHYAMNDGSGNFTLSGTSNDLNRSYSGFDGMAKCHQVSREGGDGRFGYKCNDGQNIK